MAVKLIAASPTTEPLCFLCVNAADQSMPSFDITPPVESLTAITFAPASVNNCAAIAPALP